MTVFHLSEDRAWRLRIFRRRTWAVVGACLLLRAAGGALDAQTITSFSAAAEEPRSCPFHQEILT